MSFYSYTACVRAAAFRAAPTSSSRTTPIVRVNQSNQINSINQSHPRSSLSHRFVSRASRDRPKIPTSRSRAIEPSIDVRFPSLRGSISISIRFKTSSRCRTNERTIERTIERTTERTTERTRTRVDDHGGVSDETTDRPTDRRCARARAIPARRRPVPHSTATPRQPFVTLKHIYI